MTLRRPLLVSLVAVCASNLPAVSDWYAVEHIGAAQIEQVKCPPGDVGGWYFVPTDRRADRGEWHVVSVSQLNCGDGDLCAYTDADPIHGGNYGRIYATAPRWAYRESAGDHEICHWKGWRHPSWRGRRHIATR